MSMAARFGAAIIILLLTIAPSEAGPCQASIDRIQARVDAVIAKRAGQGPWRPESLDALRGYQPTPRSIAAAEGAGDGSRVQRALNALDGARRRRCLRQPCALQRRAQQGDARARVTLNWREPPDVSRKLAEREGFEPPIGLHLCRISSAVHSTTLPPLQAPKRAILSPAVGASSKRGRRGRQGGSIGNLPPATAPRGGSERPGANY